MEAETGRGFGVLEGKVALMNSTSRWLLADSSGSAADLNRSPNWWWMRHVFFGIAYVVAVVASLSVVYAGTLVAVVWPSIGIAVWWTVTCKRWRVFVAVSAFVFLVPPLYLSLIQDISLTSWILVGLSHLVAGPAIGPLVLLFEKFRWIEPENRGGGRLFPSIARIHLPRHVYRLLIASLVVIPVSKAFTLLAIVLSGDGISVTIYLSLILRDLAGVIAIAGAGIAIASAVVRNISVAAWREFAGVLTATMVLLLLIFIYGDNLPIAYLAMLPLYWSATRLPVILAVIHGVFTTGIATIFVLWVGTGPFSVLENDPLAQASAIQLFIVICVLLSLVVSTTVQQHSALVAELEALAATIPDALLVINRSGKAFPVNGVAHNLVVKDSQGDYEMRQLKEIDGVLLEESTRPDNRALRGETVEAMLLELVDDPDDSSRSERRFYSVSASPLYLQGETEAGHALILYHDSTDEYWAMRQLQHAHDDARYLFENAPQGVATLDDSGRILQANRALGELIGVPARELQGRRLDEFITEKELQEQITAALAEPGELIHVDRYVDAVDGVRRRVALTFRTTTGEDAAPGPVLVNAVDITERQRLHELVSYLADHDALTGLVNRRRFESEFRKIYSHSEDERSDGALLLIDLDNFKTVNDVLGHHVGDELLVDFAGLLRECVRSTDIVGRLGGDEFVIALPDTDRTGATATGARIVEAVQQNMASRPDVLRRVTASVGIVMFSEARSRGVDPFILADQLLYEAKGSGRNRFAVLTPGREGEQSPLSQLTRSHIENILQRGALTLELQPILEVSTGEIAFAEGLARINPAEISVTTGEFIAAVERAGLGPELDMYVIRQGIQLLVELRRVRPDFRLSLNVSAQSCGADEVCALISAEVEKHGVAPGALILELTETAPLKDVEAARRFQRTLADHGVVFALDDFGAGFDPYRYLKQLDFRMLKIAGEFIEGMVDNSVDRSIVHSIMCLAQDEGMVTVAEFVSSEDILREVTHLGITYAQGYHIGRSVPLAEFIATYLTTSKNHEEEE